MPAKSTSSLTSPTPISVVSVVRDLPTAHETPTPIFDEYITSWRRSLTAANLARGTIKSYIQEARILCAYVARRYDADDENTTGWPLDPRHLQRSHLDAYLADELQRRSAQTVKCGCVILGAFFRWLVDEGEIDASPMTHIKAPRTPQVVGAPVLDEQAVRALLKVCAGNDFPARRDTAIMRVLLDTGLRRFEVAALTRADIDLEAGVVRVTHGKGNKPRTTFLGAKSIKAVDRYLRVRGGHRFADLPALWLSEKGALCADGVYRMVRRRAEQAGLERTWTHLFRHTWAHVWLDGGGSETDLMTQAGWTSLEMLKRYGASAKVARAQKAHKLLSPGDRF